MSAISTSVSIKVPNLYGGISDQPPHLRHLNQVENAKNASFSVINGASKRPGSRFVSQITGLNADGDYRLYPIHRDGDEQYLVLFGDGVILRVFEVVSADTLLEATVTITGAAQTYLDLNTTTSNSFRFETVADFTLVTNTTVATAGKASTDYEVPRSYPNNDARRADTPTNELFYRVANGDNSNEEAEFYQYTPQGDFTFSTVKCIRVAGTAWATPKGDWDDSASYPNPGFGFSIGFQRLNMDLTSVAWDEGNLTLTKSAAFTAYEWQDGDAINITGGTSAVAGWYEIASATNDVLTLLADAGGAGGDQTDWTTTAIGIHVEAVLPTFTETGSMHDVAARWQTALRAGGAHQALVSWTRNGNPAGFMKITSPFRGDQSLCFAPAAPSRGADITNGAAEPFKSDTITAGTGANAPTDTNPVFRRWTRVARKAQAKASLDATTMPHKLTRDTYTGDGSTPATFTLAAITWNDRLSGNQTTNPIPSLINDGDKISDVAYHDDRLVLAGEENVIFSQAGDLFNFYQEDSENLVDSDPIDVALSSEQVTLIDFMVPFRGSIVIFTKAGRQFELSSGDVFNQASVKFTPSTSYKTKSLRPVPMDNFLYFLAARQDAGVLYEYYFDDVRVSNTAGDVTAHAGNLLPQDLRSIAASDNNQMVVVNPVDCDKLYVYRSFWIGNKKEQSSWTKWPFHDDSRILDIAIIGNDLYILFELNSIITIERIPIARQIL